MKWIDVLLLFALVAVVAASAVTSLPSLGEQDALRGDMLRAHMVASGLLVVGLPIAAIWFLRHGIAGRRLSRLGRVGYWSLLVSGWATIASVYFCMVPVASTDLMHELIEMHSYAGYAMVVAAVLLLLGFRWRSGKARAA